MYVSFAIIFLMRTGLSKKCRERLFNIGYDGRCDVVSVYEWLIEVKSSYVMVIPMSDGTWRCHLVVLGSPNVNDGKLCMCELPDVYSGYRSALLGGIEECVYRLYEASVKARLMDDAEIAAMREDLRKEGFAV